MQSNPGPQSITQADLFAVCGCAAGGARRRGGKGSLQQTLCAFRVFRAEDFRVRVNKEATAVADIGSDLVRAACSVANSAWGGTVREKSPGVSCGACVIAGGTGNPSPLPLSQSLYPQTSMGTIPNHTRVYSVNRRLACGHN